MPREGFDEELDYSRLEQQYAKKGYRKVTEILSNEKVIGSEINSTTIEQKFSGKEHRLINKIYTNTVSVELNYFREINEQDTKGLVALLTDGKHGEMPTGQDKKDLTEYIRNRL